MSAAAPLATLPLSFRPAVPAPPRSLMRSVPVLVKGPRLSRFVCVSVTTPALPASVPAESVPVIATWLTVPVIGAPARPSDTVPAGADTTFSVALMALASSIAVALALSVVTVPLSSRS